MIHLKKRLKPLKKIHNLSWEELLALPSHINYTVKCLGCEAQECDRSNAMFCPVFKKDFYPKDITITINN